MDENKIRKIFLLPPNKDDIEDRNNNQHHDRTPIITKKDDLNDMA